MEQNIPSKDQTPLHQKGITKDMYSIERQKISRKRTEKEEL
jgi:hypothetical protein